MALDLGGLGFARYGFGEVVIHAVGDSTSIVGIQRPLFRRSGMPPSVAGGLL